MLEQQRKWEHQTLTASLECPTRLTPHTQTAGCSNSSTQTVLAEAVEHAQTPATQPCCLQNCRDLTAVKFFKNRYGFRTSAPTLKGSSLFSDLPTQSSLALSIHHCTAGLQPTDTSFQLLRGFICFVMGDCVFQRSSSHLHSLNLNEKRIY